MTTTDQKPDLQKTATGSDINELPELTNLAETIAQTANASMVFGEPVIREDVTVIPVAKASWGVGGGKAPWSGSPSAGGGGGMRVTPEGALTVTRAGTTFKRFGPSVARWAIPLAIFAGTVFAVRGLKKR